MTQNKKMKIILSLCVFIVSMTTYLLTVAPTVSFWDCGEFIACANILGIPHPPGTPFFMILGRAFIVAFSFIGDVAYRVNLISVLGSALGVTFAFLFTEKALVHIFKEGKSTFITFTGGLIAAMLINFSDTYWFNAVEAEVYGIAMFTVIVISWLSLIWVENRNNDKGDRILLLICYLSFLGIGFHLYTVMTFPAIFIMMHLVDHKLSWKIAKKGYIAFSILSLITLMGLVGKYGLAEGIFFSLLFASVYAVGLYYVVGIFYIKEWHKYIILTITGVALMSVVYMVGYFLFFALAVAVIYVALYIFIENKTIKRQLHLNIWFCIIAVIGYSTHAYIPIRSAQNPRIDENNPETWEVFKGFVERKQYGSESMLKRAMHRRGVLANQILSHPHMGYGGYMLAQYLPWKVGEGRSAVVDNKFKGKPGFTPDENENDPVVRSGVKFPTQMTLMPPTTKRGWQIIWFILFHIPMLAGVYYASKRKQSIGLYLFILYFVSSAGLIFYMNFSDGLRPDLMPYQQWVEQGMPPNSPPQNVHMEVRERDYFYAPGYMFMGVLFGISAAFLMQFLKEKGNSLFKPIGVILLIIAFLVPAYSNYYEHDRHNMYVPYDYARNLLQSCKPGSILFTNGDNDTFPLWFMQEVENVRRDVRVVNLSLANTDWYVHQLLEQEPKLVLGFSHEQIATLRPTGNQLKGPVEHKLGKTGLTVTLEDQTKKPYYKVQDILVMNIVQNNYPERPVHFAVTVSTPNMMGLEKYMLMEGMVYTLTNEIHNQGLEPKRTAHLVDSVYWYRELGRNDVYLNSDTKGLLSNYFATNHRLVRHTQDQIVTLDREITQLQTSLNEATEDTLKTQYQEQLDAIQQERETKIAFAEKYIAKTSTLMPWDWRHYYFGSHFYKAIKQYDKAEEMLKKGLATGKQKETITVQLGQLYMEQEKYAEAESEYKTLLEGGQTAEKFQVVYALSEVYQKQEKYNEAMDVLKGWHEENSSHQYAPYIKNKIMEYEGKLQAQRPPSKLAPIEAVIPDAVDSLQTTDTGDSAGQQ
ncbi:MAG: DUF2723 domain-containing protein [Fibrobacteria bacterium]|nr:DUF2723 domain-containing protein [Fibrobacteria bacterium]